MGRIGRRGWVIGALLVVAVVVVSASALLFQGRDDGSSASRAPDTTAARRSTTTSSTTSSTTSTTTTAAPSTTVTTAAPPPPPTPATDAPPAPVEVAPPAPAPVCDGGGSGVIDAMNADRAAGGLGGLCSSAALAGFAQSWASWMAQNQSLTHQDLGNVLAGTSFSTVAENILSGPGGMTVGQMEGAWMGSPSHRQNIMNGAYAAAGVGVAFSSDGRVWVAVEFGG